MRTIVFYTLSGLLLGLALYLLFIAGVYIYKSQNPRGTRVTYRMGLIPCMAVGVAVVLIRALAMALGL